MTSHADTINWSVKTQIDKWHDEADFLAGLDPDEVLVVEGNALMNAGIHRMLDLLLGAGGQAFNSTHCRIGVGDSSTAASASQTDLQAATNKTWKLVSSGPTRTNQSISYSVTFGSAEANWAWAEWATDFGTADSGTVTAPMLNRKVETMGTKASGSSWTITVTITIA